MNQKQERRGSVVQKLRINYIWQFIGKCQSSLVVLYFVTQMIANKHDIDKYIYMFRQNLITIC